MDLALPSFSSSVYIIGMDGKKCLDEQQFLVRVEHFSVYFTSQSKGVPAITRMGNVSKLFLWFYEL